MIRIFDVETTGIDPKEDRVVEIAAYDLVQDIGDPEISIQPAGAALVNPGRPIPPQASAVHHLVDADIFDAEPFGAVWERFAPQGGGYMIFAAHNCAFEQAFIPTPAGVDWICTYKCALRLWPDAPSHSNQVLRYWLGLKVDRAIAHMAHRAGPDAYVTAHLLAEMLRHSSVNDLITWTKEPKLYPALTFGKHRGQKWETVPGDYLVWLRDGRHDMDADLRHGAKVELLRRGSRA